MTKSKNIKDIAENKIKPEKKKTSLTIKSFEIGNFKDVSPHEAVQKFKFDIMVKGKAIFVIFRRKHKGEVDYRILPSNPDLAKEFYKFLKKKGLTIEQIIEETIEKETKDDPIDE